MFSLQGKLAAIADLASLAGYWNYISDDIIVETVMLQLKRDSMYICRVSPAALEPACAGALAMLGTA